MRYIVKPRPGLSPLDVERFSPFIDVIRPFGIPRFIRYMAAFSIEVAEARRSAFEETTRPFEAKGVAVVRRASTIRLIEPPPLLPPDPVPEPTMSLKKLDLESIWKLDITGRDVNIGVVDVGFGAHASLKKATKSHRYYDEATKTFLEGSAPGNNNLKHGTFAAALIAGEPIDNIAISVAPDASLHLVELPEVSFEDDFALTMQYLAEQQKCQVISISVGTWEPSEDMEENLKYARSDGALPVAAIGNDGKGVSMWPGACRNALSVGYCDEDGILLEGSGSTHFERDIHAVVPKIFAPGSMLVSAKYGGTWTQDNGSSFSTPLVAGLAGLLVSACPYATPDQVEEAIVTTAVREPQYAERSEFGLPSATRALEMLKILTSC
jgi:subtilisin